MAQYTLTPEFTQAVNNLIRDTAVLDDTLHSRAQRYLQIFNESNVPRGPAWAERIHASPPHYPLFTSLGLFNAMYQTADELRLVAGKRYVSAAICVSAEHATMHRAVEPQAAAAQATSVAKALHQLSSTWVAFVLWPFYALANKDEDAGAADADDDGDVDNDDDPPCLGSAADRRRCEEQVRERDDFRCFMTGMYDSRWYRRRAFPPDARFLCCRTAPIIPSDAWAREDRRSQDALLGTLAHFCGVSRAALVEKAQGPRPRNTLFLYVSVASGFRELLWSLHPTEIPNRYEIKTYAPPEDQGCWHTTSHVAFVDHSASTGASTGINISTSTSASSAWHESEAGAGVDLPDRELLRVHAALAGILHRSGAGDAFMLLRHRWIFVPGAVSWAYPAPSGSAFWRSVVEYEGPEVCLELEGAVRGSVSDDEGYAES